MVDDPFVAVPTLIVGIGGTGLKVATYIKKSLQEANRNRLPERMALLVLDTEREPRFAAGGWGRRRDDSHATGPVSIDKGEYIALTGTIRDLGLAIKNEQIEAEGDPKARRGQPHRHLSPWFQARYYLDDANVDPSLWNLDVGAGRYRQFGRMALFARLDTLTRQLRSAIGTIKQQGANRLYIHMIGSLAGGTGAALFIDVPHLVRQIARSVGFTQAPVVFGHFVLAEGFRGTPEVDLSDPGRKDDFDARCFAALRELNRLQGPAISQIGAYPIIYDPQGTGERNAAMTDSPYSSVYLYDGLRTRNPINTTSIEQGLAPAIADVVVSYIDDRSGDTFCAHSVNYKSFYASKQIPEGTPTFGSVGTYTIELPIYHITERWSHLLARDLLDTLVAPNTRERDGDIPLTLTPNQPGGEQRDPVVAADNWLKVNNTALVTLLAEWSIQAGRSTSVRQQMIDQVLNQDATSWQQRMAPSDSTWQPFVDEARAELEGSLKDPKSQRYFIEHRQPGNTDEQRSANLREEINQKLRQMIGEPQDVWMRSGGSFRSALVRLGNHHVRSFDESLVKWLREMLNGDPNVGTSVDRKQGKIGYVLAFLERIDAVLKASADILSQAAAQSSTKRKPMYDVTESERTQAVAKMARAGGFGGGNFKTYRDLSDDLAQFHKADIARQVVYDLVEKLQTTIEQALKEVQLWVRILATGRPTEGGVYGLVLDGMKEIDRDRAKGKNAVRWVIDDSESGDTYIQDRYDTYSRDKLAEVLRNMEWKVGRTDASAPLRIELHIEEKPLDRLAGTPEQRERGVRNLSQLLGICRRFYEIAWSEMSVTAYLTQNYGHRIADLAHQVYDKSGYLLQLINPNDAPRMRTNYLRVCLDGLSNDEARFLSDLRNQVAIEFDETTTAEQRAKLTENRDSDAGHNSRDRFKLTFVMFGDLIESFQIAGYNGAQRSYHTISSRETSWRPLHILPAEVNSLEIERTLSSGPREWQQRRRELDDKVVTLLEDNDRFRIGMRCLAYGETDYDWKISGERGLLLHKYTPRDRNGKSCWRLTIEPEGQRNANGQIFTSLGILATPDHYQLTPYANEPNLLQAFVQMVCIGRDCETRDAIPWPRIEATLTQMMAAHRQIWSTGRETGWMPIDRAARDAQLRGEAEDKAAQIIRLRGLIEICHQELRRYNWAWTPSGKPPEGITSDRRGKVQQFIDLWTAISGVASEEMENLGRRFVQLAIWKSGIPPEQLSLNADVEDGEQVDAGTPAPPTESEMVVPSGNVSLTPVPSNGSVDTWFCPNGHENAAGRMFCKECGASKPEAPHLADEEDPPLPNEQQNLAPQGQIIEAPTSKAQPRVCAGPERHPMPEGMRFCPECGNPLFVEAAAPKVLPRVCAGPERHPMPEGMRFCPECGNPLFVEAAAPKVLPRVCAGPE
ncbi:MAG: tubulin-like doman-containing protein, partial [Chloroflexales bacterium]